MTTLADLRSVASVPQGEGIPRRMSRFTEQVHAVIEDLKAITVSGTSYITAVDANEGLAVNAGSLGTVIYASGGLEVGASGFGVKLNGASLTLGASGLSVTTPAVNYITAVDASEGLEVNAGSLGTIINASGGLEVGASGFGVKLNGASLTLGASGIKVTTPSGLAGYGAFYLTSIASTGIGSAGTYYKAAGTTASVDLSNFTMPANNRLTYTGSPTVRAMIYCTVMEYTPRETGYRLAKNGSSLSETEVRKFAVLSDHLSITLLGAVSLATNDYVELFITNYTDTTAVTVRAIQMFILAHEV